jgi:SAM-dependent methyltransferase
LKPLYVHEESIHNLMAPREVVPLIMELFHPQSVLDVGCGIGTWLKVFEESGISDSIGVDGHYVDRNLLKIVSSKFIPQDLKKEWSLNRKFDLVISLEVAEHLPEECADHFVKTLTDHGDTIIFSAAIPLQGGQNHLNEQWPEYWQAKFIKYGYHFHDALRPLLWTNAKVDWWYKQNVFLVTKHKPKSLPFNSLSIVHPELFLRHNENERQFFLSVVEGRQGVKLAFRIFINSLVFKLKSFVSS